MCTAGMPPAQSRGDGLSSPVGFCHFELHVCLNTLLLANIIQTVHVVCGRGKDTGAAGAFVDCKML